MQPIPFTEDDLHRLETLLMPLSETGNTMRPDEVQGYFAALISGPDLVLADEWWQEILGDAPAFDVPKEAEELRALLEKLYQSIASQLGQGEPLELILYAEDESDAPDYWPWCNAYLYALDNVPSDWFELADDEGFEELLLPMMALGGMFDEGDGSELIEFAAAELAAFKEQLPQAVHAVHAYWQAKTVAPERIRHEGGQVRP